MSNVRRVYVEKKPDFAVKAKELKHEIKHYLGITTVEAVRVLIRYDVENIDGELFEYAVKTVFSEPQQDVVSYELPHEGKIFAVEFLPGQFDQRADSAAQCIQIISKKERPYVQSTKIYVLYGDISEDELESVKKHVINPVECREALLTLPETLKIDYAVPGDVKVIKGFKDMNEAELRELIGNMGLAMDEDDIAFWRPPMNVPSDWAGNVPSPESPVPFSYFLQIPYHDYGLHDLPCQQRHLPS